MCGGRSAPPPPPPPPPPPAAPPVLEQEAPKQAKDTQTDTQKKRGGLSKYKINKAGRKGAQTNSLGNIPKSNM